jgi:hypothetical protein
MNTGSIGLKRGTVRVVPYDPDWDMSTNGVLFSMPPKRTTRFERPSSTGF